MGQRVADSCRESGATKSSIDKFYSPEQVKAIADKAGQSQVIWYLSSVVRSSNLSHSYVHCASRAQRLGLRDNTKFKPLWIVDFPLFEWDAESGRYYAMPPFTSPKPEDVEFLDSDPGGVRANAYDFVCNVEIGGGSIRIHDSKLKARMFEILGFGAEQAEAQFGFLMNAFVRCPTQSLAFDDRLCSLFGGVSHVTTSHSLRIMQGVML